MSEQNDKPLHDWVRQSLDTYRPAYEPAEWAKMQRILRRRRWLRSVLGLAILVFLNVSGWLVFRPDSTDSAIINRLRKTAKPIHPPVSERTASRMPNKVIKPSTEIKKIAFPVRKPEHKPLLAANSSTHQIQTPAPLIAVNTPKPTLTNLTGRISTPQTVAFSPEETAITQQMVTHNFGSDSTSYHTLERNLSRWPDAVIVCDITSSMYPYTTQLFAWFNRNARKPSVKGMVFFTDCDSLGQQTRPGGPPGRMYVTRERNATAVVPILLNAARNTVHNEDDAENNVEALLFAQNAFPDAKHLILIADNISRVKDMNLLKNVGKPVHVVLCGTTGSDETLAFQPDYYTIATQTRGSLHTLEDDVNPAEISAANTLRVGPRYYRYNARKRQFKVTSFDHRPRRFLKFIWF